MDSEINPDRIMQIGMGFWASKTVLSAVELELFTVLGSGSLTGSQLGDRLELHPRSLFDFLDTLVSLNLLVREGSGTDAVYRNTPETARYLDQSSPAYIGGILEMANARLYSFWGNLTEALQTGLPQNEASKGEDLFAELYADEHRLEQFLRGMQGIQMGNFHALANKVDFSGYRTHCDIGGANGTLAAILANRHPHLECASFDLPQVKSVAERHVAAFGAGKVKVIAGDFFKDPLPQADVLTMANVLHDWDEPTKIRLIQKAYDALPRGGVFIAIENVIDNERQANTFGLLMSLNMLIETPGGFDYTLAQFESWASSVGFRRTELISLTGPASAVLAFK